MRHNWTIGLATLTTLATLSGPTVKRRAKGTPNDTSKGTRSAACRGGRFRGDGVARKRHLKGNAGQHQLAVR